MASELIPGVTIELVERAWVVNQKKTWFRLTVPETGFVFEGSWRSHRGVVGDVRIESDGTPFVVFDAVRKFATAAEAKVQLMSCHARCSDELAAIA